MFTFSGEKIICSFICAVVTGLYTLQAYIHCRPYTLQAYIHYRPYTLGLSGKQFVFTIIGYIGLGRYHTLENALSMGNPLQSESNDFYKLPYIFYAYLNHNNHI